MKAVVKLFDGNKHDEQSTITEILEYSYVEYLINKELSAEDYYDLVGIDEVPDINNKYYELGLVITSLLFKESTTSIELII